jgi:hypothetical protein
MVCSLRIVFILSTVLETGNTEVWAPYQLKRDSISSKICSLLARTLVCPIYLKFFHGYLRLTAVVFNLIVLNF